MSRLDLQPFISGHLNERGPHLQRGGFTHMDAVEDKPPLPLAEKKYLYWTQNEIFVNPGTDFIFGLQGLGTQELQQFGLQDRLSLVQAQDLCGNAFTSNVIAVVGLAALLHILT